MNYHCHKDIPLVSIIMPNKNGMPYLKKSIESVLNQIIKNFEIIVIDGCSTDESIDYLKSLNDGRLKIIIDSDSKGVMESRKKGIFEGKGSFIAFLDSDDIWIKTKLEEQIEFMKKKKTNLSYTNFSTIDHLDELISINKYFHDHLNQKNFASKRSILNSSVMVESRILKENFPQEIYSGFAEDLYLWGSLVYKGYDANGLNKNLVKYRITPGARSKNLLQNLYAVWNLYLFKFKLGIMKSITSFCMYIIDVIKRKITR